MGMASNTSDLNKVTSEFKGLKKLFDGVKNFFDHLCLCTKKLLVT